MDDPLVAYECLYAHYSYARFLQSDARGSIVYSSTHTNGGAVVNAYDEYGQPGSGNVGRFQYTRAATMSGGHREPRSQVWLPELGMYYYKARIYSPRLGRFMQTDPIGYEDNANLYAYVANDPINGRDPSGKSKEDNQNVVLDDPEVEAAFAATAKTMEQEQGETLYRFGPGDTEPTQIGESGTRGRNLNTATASQEEIDGAVLLVHPHENQVEDAQVEELRGGALKIGADALNPGPDDFEQVAQTGIPLGIVNNGRAAVLEIIDGKPEIRMIVGSQTPNERRATRERVRQFRRRR